MNILLDTHIVLWYFLGSEKLSRKVIEMIENPDNSIFVSIATLWEVQIKHLKYPDKFSIDADQLAELCDDDGFFFMQIEPEHISQLSGLSRKSGSSKHGDPFDRMLLAQAKYEDMVFITHDSKLMDYEERCVVFV